MEDLVIRLHKRADIRRSNQDRKSVQEGKPDRLADLLDEAGREITDLRQQLKYIDPACLERGCACYDKY